MKLARSLCGEPKRFYHGIRHLLVRFSNCAAGHFQIARVLSVELLGELPHRPVSPIAHP